MSKRTGVGSIVSLFVMAPQNAALKMLAPQNAALKMLALGTIAKAPAVWPSAFVTTQSMAIWLGRS